MQAFAPHDRHGSHNVSVTSSEHDDAVDDGDMHMHEETDHAEASMDAVWKGMAVLAGIYVFFVTELIISIFWSHTHHSDNVRLFFSIESTGWSKKTDTQFYCWDNFGNSAPILTILSLLQAEIYGA